jgi:hypothetical protein
MIRIGVATALLAIALSAAPASAKGSLLSFPDAAAETAPMSFAANAPEDVPATGTCTLIGNWSCSSGSCIKQNAVTGVCCPEGYAKSTRVGYCSK